MVSTMSTQDKTNKLYVLEKTAKDVTFDIRKPNHFLMGVRDKDGYLNHFDITLEFDNPESKTKTMYFTLNQADFKTEKFVQSICLVRILTLDKSKTVFNFRYRVFGRIPQTGPTEVDKHDLYFSKPGCCFEEYIDDLDDDHESLFVVSVTLGSQLVPKIKAFDTQKKLLDESVLTDFIIQTKTKDFPCHKVVLGAESEFFKNLFISKLKEGHENLIDWSHQYNADTVDDLLFFIYTHQIPNKVKETCFQLLDLACLCQLDGLKDITISTVLEIMAVDNVLESLQLAIRYGIDDLKKNALNFIFHNYEDVSSSDGWKNMDADTAKMIMMSSFGLMGAQKLTI